MLYIFLLKIQGIFLMFLKFICYYVYRICVNYFDKEEREMTAGFDLSQEMETFARGENFHAQTFLGHIQLQKQDMSFVCGPQKLNKFG